MSDAIDVAMDAAPGSVVLVASIEMDTPGRLYNIVTASPATHSLLQMTIDAAAMRVLRKQPVSLSDEGRAHIEELIGMLPPVAVDSASSLLLAAAQYPAGAIHRLDLEIHSGALVYTILLSDEGQGVKLRVSAITGADLAQATALPRCNADISGDGVVSAVDLAHMLASWGPGGGPPDLNYDQVVSVKDLSLLVSDWGGCPSQTP